MYINVTKLVKTPDDLGNTISIDFILLATDDNKNSLESVYHLTTNEVIDANADENNLIRVIEEQSALLAEQFNDKFKIKPIPIVADQPTLDSFVISVDVSTGEIRATKSVSVAPSPVLIVPPQ